MLNHLHIYISKIAKLESYIRLPAQKIIVLTIDSYNYLRSTKLFHRLNFLRYRHKEQTFFVISAEIMSVIQKKIFCVFHLCCTPRSQNNLSAN